MLVKAPGEQACDTAEANLLYGAFLRLVKQLNTRRKGLSAFSCWVACGRRGVVHDAFGVHLARWERTYPRQSARFVLTTQNNSLMEAE